MRHVVWREGSSGPGVDAVRAFLREYLRDALAMASRKGDGSLTMPATGPFDGNLRRWVKQFQTAFNQPSGNPAVARRKAQLANNRLVESGEVDHGTRFVMGIPEELARDDAILLPRGVSAVRSPLTASELAAAKPGDRFVGWTYRISEVDKLLEAIGLVRASAGASNKRIAPLDDGAFMVPEGHILYSAAKDESECAALVQSFGVPNTNRWRRGPRVQDIESLVPGTVVATLGTGVYLSDYSGKSHVGIFLWKTGHGLAMLDQYKGGDGTLGVRIKRFGAPHRRTAVKPSRYIDPTYSYRMEVTDAHGNKSYARDYSLESVRYKTNLTGDGSEYYVLLDDGHVARHASDQDRQRTRKEERQAATEFVKELFEGVNLTGSEQTARELREALKNVQPVPPPGT